MAALFVGQNFSRSTMILIFLLLGFMHGSLAQDYSSDSEASNGPQTPEDLAQENLCITERDSNDGQEGAASFEYYCPSVDYPSNHTECCGFNGLAQCCPPSKEKSDGASSAIIPYRNGIIIAVVVVVLVTLITSGLIVCILWSRCPLYKYNCLRANHGEPLAFSVSKTSDGNVAIKNISKLPDTPDRGQYKPLSTEGEDHDDTMGQNVTRMSELNTTEVTAAPEEGAVGEEHPDTVENPNARLSTHESTEGKAVDVKKDGEPIAENALKEAAGEEKLEEKEGGQSPNVVTA